MIKLRIKAGNGKKLALEAVAVFHFEDADQPGAMSVRLDGESGGVISRLHQLSDFSGRLNETALLYPAVDTDIKRIIVVGLGKKEKFDRDKLRGAAAKAAQTAREHKLRDLALALEAGYLDMVWADAAAAAAEGAVLGLYRFRKYKTQNEENEADVETLTILLPERRHLKAVRKAVLSTEKICRAVYLARNLVSMPSNELTPSRLGDEALKLAQRRRGIEAKVIGSREMRRLGMNALLGVARGSREEPKFIILDYRGADTSVRPLVLVGKAITFDSGGISLKAAEKMDEMKSDMAGGAAVLAAIGAAAELELPLNLVGLIPATENLPGGMAYKPGDILRTMSGQTVEVLNTDAEGRLILADALHYAQRYQPAAIVDIATLTGACVVALGEQVAGMVGTDPKVKEIIRKAAEQTGELVWELPLWENYQEMIKSDIADIKNSAGRFGGAITAAAFLSRFTGSVPWVHLDIAGPAWLTKDRPYQPKGATGIGVRLFIQFFMNWLEAN